MKRLLLASLLCGFAFAASAQNVTISGQVEAETTLTQPDTDAALNERLCLRETGSRIVAHHNARSSKTEQRCVAASGRSYTQEDIQRTGVVDLADALRMLDPSIH